MGDLITSEYFQRNEEIIPDTSLYRHNNNYRARALESDTQAAKYTPLVLQLTAANERNSYPHLTVCYNYLARVISRMRYSRHDI